MWPFPLPEDSPVPISARAWIDSSRWFLVSWKAFISLPELIGGHTVSGPRSICIGFATDMGLTELACDRAIVPFSSTVSSFSEPAGVFSPGGVGDRVAGLNQYSDALTDSDPDPQAGTCLESNPAGRVMFFVDATEFVPLDRQRSNVGCRRRFGADSRHVFRAWRNLRVAFV